MAEAAGLVLKVCVLGSSRVGKTALCRALAEQPLTFGEYQPTYAVRIQECGRQLGQEAVKVQLWDVAAGQQYQGYWELLANDVDGVIMIIDPEHPEQEQELEQLYLRFAQRNSLTMKQCLVLGLTVSNSNSSSSWSGLRGKLRKLPSGQVSINWAAPEECRREISVLFDKLLAGCLAPKKDRIERAVMGD